MIDAYVINLERCFQKKAELIQNITLNQIDKRLNVKFINGIDGSKLSSYEKSQFKICPLWMDPILKTGITTGEIGCALSHYTAWKEFYDSEKQHAIFLEDDISFDKCDFEKKLDYLLAYPEDADIIYILRNQQSNESQFNYDTYEYFQEINASYWTCAYFLTRKGATKLLCCNYLQNLIVIDEFLPTLYDDNYSNIYKKFYNTSLKAYSVKERYSFVNLAFNAFIESSTFHSNYHEFDSNIIAFVSDKNVSYSSLSRFIKTCKKFSIQYKIINMEDIKQHISNIDANKYIIILNCKHSFFINNPLDLIINKEEELYYSCFSELLDISWASDIELDDLYYSCFLDSFSNLLENYENNSLYFFGKQYVLFTLLNNLQIKHSNTNDLIKCLYIDDTSIDYSSNSIIVDGVNNTLMLDKYENYNINKIHSSYGYKNIDINTKYEYNICVNVMVYDHISLDCLHILNVVDYPKELLNVNIYTSSTLNLNNIDSSISINIMSEIEAIAQIYTKYSEYDYVWVIYSNVLLNEPSILKNYIDSDKMVVSGLTIKKNETYSNFWGTITSSGWYLRSDDYLDILNREKINIWNVPYINGNIFFNKKIFDRYNLLEDNTFDNLDMKICYNLRKNGEGMYLINEKIFGHFLPEPLEDNPSEIIQDVLPEIIQDVLPEIIQDVLPEIIQSALKNINDWQINEIFSPEYLKFYIDNDKTVLKEYQQDSDIWCFPFFTPEFCDYLVTLAEINNKWSPGYTDADAFDVRINTVENIPTQDIHLKDLQLEPFWLNIIRTHFKKIISTLYKYKTKDYNIAFIVKYDAKNGQSSVQAHHDSSVYTTNIALSNGTDYDGGKLFFHSKNVTVFNKNKGYICIHPGRITHYHEAFPITRGKRYVLVSFNE